MLCPVYIDTACCGFVRAKSLSADLHPDHARAQFNLGYDLEQEGDYERALAHCTESLRTTLPFGQVSIS